METVESSVTMVEMDLCLHIPQILNECRNSYTVHRRKRTASAERVIRFIAILRLAVTRKIRHSLMHFLQEFLRFILNAVHAANKSARFRACQIISEFVSIKQRTVILQHGLAKECLKLLKDEWLIKGFGGDSVALLRFLDVETYELVAEAVLEALLKAGMVNLQDGQLVQNGQLMEAEIALYWRTICGHLQIEAQGKSSDAAATGGTEVTVYAAEASEMNDLIEKILSSTVSDYVELVKAHLVAGVISTFNLRHVLVFNMEEVEYHVDHVAEELRAIRWVLRLLQERASVGSYW